MVDDRYRCVGLITVKDIEKAVMYPEATKDAAGRLRVAAASTVGDAGFERAMALAEAGADVVVIDTAHGHSASVSQVVERIKRESNRIQIIAGNVATYDATRALIDAGADAVKVGIGPGSICTTRIVAGVGVPQIMAIDGVATALKGTGVPVIADGGIRYSGDVAKAIAAGADCIMMGGAFAGTEEPKSLPTSASSGAASESPSLRRAGWIEVIGRPPWSSGRWLRRSRPPSSPRRGPRS